MILAITGLAREARIIAQPNIVTVVGGGDANALEKAIEAALDAHIEGIVSVGICGALSPSLRVGDCIVASEVSTPDDRIGTDRAWSGQLMGRISGAISAALVGTDRIVAQSAEKSRLYRDTGAAAVDMESHVAGRVAKRHGLPFAVIRAVSDSAGQSLPPAALAAMSTAGGVDVRAVLRSVIARPSQLAALARTAWEAEKAFQALSRCRDALAVAPARRSD